MKKIVQINNKFSIWGDSNQYILRLFIGKQVDKKTGEMKEIYREEGYFGTLEALMQDLFLELSRSKLLSGKEKTMKEVRDIILDTKKEILKIMRPFSSLK